MAFGSATVKNKSKQNEVRLMRYPFEVMFSCNSGRFKALCDTWEEVEKNVNTYGVSNLLSIQENH